MLALSPSLASTIGWYFENHTSHDNHDQNFVHGDHSERFDSILHFSTSQTQFELDQTMPQTAICRDQNMFKKLDHNASERDRRKKMNGLYSSLRSLLPEADQTKKLSIPVTVSRVVKYIPELQQQVMGLIQKKEELLSRTTRQGDETHEEEQPAKSIARSTSIAVWASHLDDRQIVVQISSDSKVHKTPLSDILLNLEEDGLLVLNASSFESQGGKVFCNLHLQVENTHKLECEILSEKLISLYDKRENLLP
ncbi:transcription factor ORG2-like isoform X1 [Fagus crenata]